MADGSARSVRIREVFQVRVTPKLKWPFKKFAVNFDSQLVFPEFSLAEKFVPYYIRELVEMTVLDKKQEYEAGVIKLTVYDGVEEVR
jgi:hypothetical protein